MLRKKMGRTKIVTNDGVIKLRKVLKKNILDLFQTIYGVHVSLKELIDKKEYATVQSLLNDCQEAAIQIGTSIDNSEGDGLIAVKFLEGYCESVYQIAVGISDEYTGSEIQSILDEKLIKAENSVKKDIKVRLEVVFMPYKASMWDSLESVWMAARDDENCDAYVIPIPYFDKNPDGSFDEMHYEGESFPDYVPVTHYDDYDIETRRPDVIYIHNPYDRYNKVTSVDPRFYSSELKKWTDCLVYIPYYVLPKKVTENFVNTSGVVYADKVIVQGRSYQDDYINILKDYISKDILQNKIIAMGSPKIDKIVRYVKSDMPVSEEWKKHINGRKVIFLNTNVSLILNNSERFIDNLYRMFDVFKRHNDEYVVLWREHPLSIGTIKSMRPYLLEDYIKAKEYFLNEKIGFLDNNPEAYDAIKVSDCYFGSGGSLTVVYAVTGKPMLVTDYDYPNKISEDNISLEHFMKTLCSRTYYIERNKNTLDLFLDNIEVLESQKEKRFQNLSELLENIDGLAGYRIYKYISQNL